MIAAMQELKISRLWILIIFLPQNVDCVERKLRLFGVESKTK
jgi:hypothetical protein